MVPAAVSASEEADSAPAPAGGASLVKILVFEDVTLVGSGDQEDPTIKNVTLRCPKGYMLLHGGSSRWDVVEERAQVRGPDVFFVQLAYAGTRRETVRVWADCGKWVTTAKPLQPVPLPTPRVIEQSVTLAPGVSTPASTRCPAGTFPVGGYAGGERVNVLSSHPDYGGWNLNFLRDLEAEGKLEVGIQVVCLPTKVALPAVKKRARTAQANPAPARLRFSISRRIQKLDKAGLTRVTATCATGTQAVGGGYSLLSHTTPPGPPGFLGTEIAKRSYTVRYFLEQAPEKPPEVAVFAICLTTRIA